MDWIGFSGGGGVCVGGVNKEHRQRDRSRMVSEMSAQRPRKENKGRPETSSLTKAVSHGGNVFPNLKPKLYKKVNCLLENTNIFLID